MNNFFWLIPLSSLLALGFAWYFFKMMLRESEGNSRMIHIAQVVREGAMSYLRQQYKVVFIVFLVLAVLFAGMAYLGLQNNWVPFAFLNAT